jgi:hypothetical protein
MCFFTESCMPSRLQPRSCARMPMVVNMQVPSAVATRSVGENASPRPLLSTGASVVSVIADGPCFALQRNCPR